MNPIAAFVADALVYGPGYSYSVTREMLEDFATIAGIETATIGPETNLTNFKQDLRNNDVYYYLAQAFRA